MSWINQLKLIIKCQVHLGSILSCKWWHQSKIKLLLNILRSHLSSHEFNRLNFKFSKNPSLSRHSKLLTLWGKQPVNKSFSRLTICRQCWVHYLMKRRWNRNWNNEKESIKNFYRNITKFWEKLMKCEDFKRIQIYLIASLFKVSLGYNQKYKLFRNIRH